MRIRDFCPPLDGIAERQALGSDAQRLAAASFPPRQVEISAELGESGDGRRVGLPIEDRRVRKDSAERVVLRPHGVEVDDYVWSIRATFAEKIIYPLYTGPVRKGDAPGVGI